MHHLQQDLVEPGYGDAGFSEAPADCGKAGEDPW